MAARARGPGTPTVTVNPIIESQTDSPSHPTPTPPPLLLNLLLDLKSTPTASVNLNGAQRGRQGSAGGRRPPCAALRVTLARLGVQALNFKFNSITQVELNTLTVLPLRALT